MKNSLFIMILIALLASGQAFASSVTNVELSYSPGFTVAKIAVEGPVRFTHQTEEAKDGKPFRVIVDVLSATHSLGANNFFSLPPCPIKAVRSSQYAVKPENIVRIVFDTDRERIYRIESDENTIKILFPDKATAEFAAWSSTVAVAAKKAARAVAVKPAQQKAGKGKTAAQLNKSINEDRMLSLSDGSQPKVEKNPVVATASNASVKRAAKVDVPYGPEVDWATLEQDRKAAIEEKAASRKKVTVAATDATPPGKIADLRPAQPKKAQVKKAALKKSPPVKKATPKVKPPTTVKSAPPKSPAKSGKGTLASTAPAQPVAKIEGKKQKSKTQTVAKKQSQDKKAAAHDSKKLATADDKGSKKKSTSRFRRSSAESRKIKGTLVAQFPKRLVIKYKTKKYRDPFETLINETRTYNSPIEKRVPNVEGLRLVGIIESGTNKNSALFEDKDGYGYILMTGDKVQKGYVLRVEEDRVYFQIFEYGWSRTVALNLEN